MIYVTPYYDEIWCNFAWQITLIRYVIETWEKKHVIAGDQDIVNIYLISIIGHSSACMHAPSGWQAAKI